MGSAKSINHGFEVYRSASACQPAKRDDARARVLPAIPDEILKGSSQVDSYTGRAPKPLLSAAWMAHVSKTQKQKDGSGFAAWLTLLAYPEKFAAALRALPENQASEVLNATEGRLHSHRAKIAWLRGWRDNAYGNLSRLQALGADKNPDVRFWAASACMSLRERGAPIAQHWVQQGILCPHIATAIRSAAPNLLNNLRQAATQAVCDNDASKRCAAARILRDIKPVDLKLFLTLAQDAQEEVVIEALEVARDISQAEIEKLACAVMSSPNARVHRLAIGLLEALPHGDHRRNACLKLCSLGKNNPDFWRELCLRIDSGFDPLCGLDREASAIRTFLTLCTDPSYGDVARTAALEQLKWSVYRSSTHDLMRYAVALHDLDQISLSLQVSKVLIRVHACRPEDAYLVWKHGSSHDKDALADNLIAACLSPELARELYTWLRQRPETFERFIQRDDSHLEKLVDTASAAGCDLTLVGPDGATMLHAAARAGDVQTAKRLIALGVAQDIRNYAGETHLDIALERGEWTYWSAFQAVSLPRWLTADNVARLTPDALKRLPHDVWDVVLRPLLQRPDALENFFAAALKQCHFELKDGGTAFSSWDAILRAVVIYGSYAEPRRESAPLADALREAEKTLPPALDVLATLHAWEADGFKPTATLGRSVILSAEGRPERRVLKVQKVGEEPASLRSEAGNLAVLRKFARNRNEGLQSPLPEPLGVGEIAGGAAALSPWLPAGDNSAFHRLVAPGDGPVGAYAYACAPEYLQYVMDVPWSQDAPPWRRSISDVFWLLDQGVAFTELTPLYHDTNQLREDAGRYRALNGIFDRHSGNGCLRDWYLATKFANFRGALGGLADFTPMVRISEAACAQSSFRKKFFHHVDLDDAQFAAAMRASFQAEVLLSWELFLGRRAAETGNWEAVPDQLKDMYQHAVGLCCRGGGADSQQRAALQQMMAGAVDWIRYAQQMRVFMTPEHAQYVNEEKFPDNLFDIKPTLGATHAHSFDPLRGYVAEGGVSLSLGPAHGPYPIKDGEKARAIVAILDLLIRSRRRSRFAVLGAQNGSRVELAAACLGAVVAGLGSYWLSRAVLAQ